MLSIDGDEITATLGYDPNGNQITANGSRFNRTVTYTSYNKPSCIQQGASSIGFYDDVDHQRFQLNTYGSSSCVAPTGTTNYFDAFGVHAELVTFATIQWNDYLMVGGSMVGVRFLQGTAVTLRYFHQDHLGSIAVLTDQNGAVVERDAYDAWGKRRFTNGNDDPTNSIVSQTIQGFTGQEMLASAGLVHLNGRVYDPYVGRMLSADPVVVGDPLSGQSWNRYSYVYNNPLAFTDPTGYCPICLGTFFSRVGAGIGTFLRAKPLVGQVLIIAAAALCAPGEALCAGIAATTATFVVAGLSTGRLDLALKAAAISAATAAAFYGVGDLTQQFLPIDPDTGLRASMQFGDAAHLFNIAGHALVGCGAAVAAGGGCGPGALSGAVPSLAGPLVNNLPFQAALVANSTLGGLASVAGGGKFANGAVTGAFGYLFNANGHRQIGDNGGPPLEDDPRTVPMPIPPATAFIMMMFAIPYMVADYLMNPVTTVTLDFSIARFGEAAEHILDAQAAGQPDVLTINRPGADANRQAATGGLQPVPGRQLDEYPPAMFQEGGANASVRAINPSDNMSAGAYMGNVLRNLPDGTRVQIRVTQ